MNIERLAELQIKHFNLSNSMTYLNNKPNNKPTAEQKVPVFKITLND